MSASRLVSSATAAAAVPWACSADERVRRWLFMFVNCVDVLFVSDALRMSVLVEFVQSAILRIVLWNVCGIHPFLLPLLCVRGGRSRASTGT